MSMKFVDTVTLDGVKVTQDGYLVADAYTVRTGIQKYAGYEVGRPDLTVVSVFRPEAEVFSKDSLQSLSHAPVTNDHPSELVNADNWRDYAVGETSTDVLRDGERLKVPLILKDKSVISDVQGGKRQLSAGYLCQLDWEEGTAPDGTEYQAVQRNIRFNHVAVVRNGRAGSDFRIGDSADNWGTAPITQDRDIPMQLRTIVVDGISIQVTDQGAEAIQKLNGQIAALTADNLTLTADHKKALADKDEVIGDLKVQLKKAQDASVVDVDALVAQRTSLVDAARKLVPDVKVEGVSDADIRKAVVVAKLGEDVVKDADDNQVIGMFKALTKDAAPQDPLRPALRDAAPLVTVNDSQTKYETRQRDAWKRTA